MDDKARRTQDWRDSHPLVVWRKAQDLTSLQATEKLGITARRLLELEIGSRPSDTEMKTITERTGIDRDQWTAWELANPRGGPAVPPKGQEDVRDSSTRCTPERRERYQPWRLASPSFAPPPRGQDL
jgi:hypothetical protein